MSVVTIQLNGTPMDGQNVTFEAPCDCSAVTAIRAYYASEETRVSTDFVMKDARGNDLTGLGNLFKAGSYVQVILDTKNNVAYLQNAATNGYLEHQIENRSVVLAAASWTTSAPYTQTVSVSGITADDEPMILMGTPSTPNATNYKSTKKAFGMIDRAVTGSGTITFYCYSKKPTVAIPIIVKGA